MDEKFFEKLTEEQREALKKCKTPEEMMELITKEGMIEVDDAEIDDVSGGASFKEQAAKTYNMMKRLGWTNSSHHHDTI